MRSGSPQDIDPIHLPGMEVTGLSPPRTAAQHDCQRGDAAAARGDWAAAHAAYQRAVAEDPGFAPAALGLSHANSRMGAHRAAREAALAAHACATDDPALIFAIARRLRHFNEYAALESCLALPALAASAPPQALAEAAVMLSSIGSDAAAFTLVEHALGRAPHHAAALYVRGNLHAFQGRFDAAAADYESALRADPRLFQASWMLAGLRTQTVESNHVARLRTQLGTATPGGMGEVYLSFALHKELHDLGQYPEAWTALARGCAAKRALLNYRPEATDTLFQQLQQVCTPEFVAAEVAGSTGAPTPVFIVGMHRSGTSLLERMLAGHSAVADAGESYAFAEQMKLTTDHGPAGVLATETVRRAADADFAQVARGYGDAARWLARGRPFFTEKLPGNFLHAGFIARALPNARILHLVRDPMDTCFSNLRTLFSEAAPYSYDQRELARYWRGYHHLMRHWHEILPGRILDVDYAELVRDPPGQARRIAAFCGFPYESGMLEVGRAGSSVSTASLALVRNGVRQDRGRQWSPYAHALQVLQEQLAIVD